jgi:hypothetical protein
MREKKMGKVAASMDRDNFAAPADARWRDALTRYWNAAGATDW